MVDCGFAPPITIPYFNVIASPLRSTFAISPTWRPDNSSTAPFWLVSTIARAPPPTARTQPAQSPIPHHPDLASRQCQPRALLVGQQDRARAAAAREARGRRAIDAGD